MTRLVTFVGQDEDFAMFSTPSWTGKDETYTIWVDKRTWTVRCDCQGSLRWGLYKDLQNPESSHGCKHSRQTSEIIKRYLENKDE